MDYSDTCMDATNEKGRVSKGKKSEVTARNLHKAKVIKRAGCRRCSFALQHPSSSSLLPTIKDLIRSLHVHQKHHKTMGIRSTTRQWQNMCTACMYLDIQMITNSSRNFSNGQNTLKCMVQIYLQSQCFL